MPDSLMYSEDAYVLLEPNQPEQFLSPTELLDKLKVILAEQQTLPKDLERFTSLEEQAKYLMETSCELDVGPDRFLQWYVVRIEK